MSPSLHQSMILVQDILCFATQTLTKHERIFLFAATNEAQGSDKNPVEVRAIGILYLIYRSNTANIRADEQGGYRGLGVVRT